MKQIIFENKYKNGIKGLYHGQCFDIDLRLKEDKLNVLTNDEVEEVTKAFNEESKSQSSMLSIEIGCFVRLNVIEGGDIFEYELEVTSIDEQGYDDEGNYFCIAYGNGITKADEEMAEEYTHRIEPSNFALVLI